MKRRGERAIGNEKIKEELGSVGCRPTEYVHGEIGRARIEKGKPWQQSLRRRQSIWSGVGKVPYLLTERWRFLLSHVQRIAKSVVAPRLAPHAPRMNSCINSMGVWGHKQKGLGTL